MRRVFRGGGHKGFRMLGPGSQMPGSKNKLRRGSEMFGPRAWHLQSDRNPGSAASVLGLGFCSASLLPKHSSLPSLPSRPPNSPTLCSCPHLHRDTQMSSPTRQTSPSALLAPFRLPPHRSPPFAARPLKGRRRHGWSGFDRHTPEPPGSASQWLSCGGSEGQSSAL